MSRLLSSNLPQFSSNRYVSHVNYSKKPHKNSFIVRLDTLILCITLFKISCYNLIAYLPVWNSQQSVVCPTKTPNGRSILFWADAVTD